MTGNRLDDPVRYGLRMSHGSSFSLADAPWPRVQPPASDHRRVRPDSHVGHRVHRPVRQSWLVMPLRPEPMVSVVAGAPAWSPRIDSSPTCVAFSLSVRVPSVSSWIAP